MSDSNNDRSRSPRENPTDESRAPGMSKQVMTRLLAVLLFVGVGSIAVAQTVFNNRTNDSETDTAKLDPLKTNDEGNSDENKDQPASSTTPRLAKKPVVAKLSGTTDSSDAGIIVPESPSPANTDTSDTFQAPNRSINPKVSSNIGAPSKTTGTRESGLRQPLGQRFNPSAREFKRPGNLSADESTEFNSTSQIPKRDLQNSFNGSSGFSPAKSSTKDPNSSRGFNPMSLPKSQTPIVSDTMTAPNLRQPRASSLTPTPKSNAAFDPSRELRPIQDPIAKQQNRPQMLPGFRGGNALNTRDAAPNADSQDNFSTNPTIQKSIPPANMPLNANSRTPDSPSQRNSGTRFNPKRFPPTTRSATDSMSNQQTSNQPPTQNVSTPILRPRSNSGNPTFNRTPAETFPGRSNMGSTQPTSLSSALTMPKPGERNLEGMQAPSITIEKIAPREIQLNTPAEFQLVIKNTGRNTATQVQIHDEIPVGTELIESNPQPSNRSGSRIMWNLGSMKPGQEKRIQMKLRATRTGDIGSVAHVSFSAQASMRTRVTKPMLSILQSTNPRVLIGDTVLLDITVKNDGDGAARNVVIQEDVPPQLSFNDGYKELEYEIGTLGPGQSKTIKLALKAAKIGRFRNVMLANATGGLQAQHAIDMEVIAPRLVVSSDGPNRRFLKRNATHEFTIQNSGTAKATNVELVARLPKGLRFVSADNQAKYDANGHAVHWSLAELSPNLVAAVHVTTTPAEPGSQTILFEAVADLGQKTSMDHVLNVEHLVDIFFDIDDLVDPIEVGSDTAYQIRIVNQGTKTATNVLLNIDFPNGMQPISVDGNITAQVRGQQIVFSPIASINPGDEIKMTINARGTAPGDHRIAMRLQTDGRDINVTKQESTKVYSDR